MKITRVYEITREYGGPEEGGWWYDEYVLLEEHPANDFHAVMEKWRDKRAVWRVGHDRVYGECNHGYCSTVGESMICIILEDENESHSRPYYC